MNRTLNVKTAIALAGVAAAAWFVSICYEDYWVPARDLKALGFDWVEPWTPRAIDKVSWMNGSQAVYSFELTPERANILRDRCLGATSGQSSVGPCYVAQRKIEGRPEITVEVQRGLLRLYYTGG